jgi:hypothetical protein
VHALEQDVDIAVLGVRAGERDGGVLDGPAADHRAGDAGLAAEIVVEVHAADDEHGRRTARIGIPLWGRAARSERHRRVASV